MKSQKNNARQKLLHIQNHQKYVNMEERQRIKEEKEGQGKSLCLKVLVNKLIVAMQSQKLINIKLNKNARFLIWEKEAFHRSMQVTGS
jgi:hypothetical protein